MDRLRDLAEPVDGGHVTDSGRVWAAALLAGLALFGAVIYVARVSRVSLSTQRNRSQSAPVGTGAEPGEFPARRVDSSDFGKRVQETDGNPASVSGAASAKASGAPDSGAGGATSIPTSGKKSPEPAGAPGTRPGCDDGGWDVATCGARWNPLRPGLAHRKVVSGGTTFQIVRVDLDHHALVVADARREGRTMATVEELARETGAVAAINGTFFDEHQRPLGWLVSNGEELNPFRNISWWAALAVIDDDGVPRADLLTHSRLNALTEAQRESVRFALQVGPRTVFQGRPIRLKRQHAARAAACVHVDGSVLLLVSQGVPVESNVLSRFMAAREVDGGLECLHGVMLDGGPSAQLYVSTGDFRLSARGGWPVPNAIAVVPREWMARGGTLSGEAR